VGDKRRINAQSLAGTSCGSLFVVSTPVGNLKDITDRAREVLGRVGLIAAEDTRRARKLLSCLGIPLPSRIVSFHSFNEHRRLPQLIESLKRGEDVALITDSGTPGVADPAYSIIVSTIGEGCSVVPVPGVSACLAALVVSGLPMHRFAFEGFLPRQGVKRRARLERLRGDDRTLIFYEAPHRLVAMLRDAFLVLGDRPASVSRELTKCFEETVRGHLSSLLAYFEEHRPRGEFVVVIGSGTEEE
jgi:16S rRNA (cytidine1402-2'-O)-methyltransferase